MLYNNLINSGGDGDAIWYLKYQTIDEILPLLEEYNSKLKFPFTIESTNNTIHWGQNQEWAIITTDKELYNACTHFEFVLKA